MNTPTNTAPSVRDGDLAKALRDAYGQGCRHAVGIAPETSTAYREKRDAWIRQYMARMPVAVPSVRDGEEVGHLERVRHVKRGTEYEVLGEAEAQVSYDRIGAAHRVGRPLWDECRLTVYRCAETGKLWARFTDEFRDGRFETIAAAPVSSSGDFSGDLAEIAAIREMLLAGQGDDVGKQILPDLTEDMSLFAMVASCIHLLEKRRDAIEHIEFAAPVSSTGDGDGGELEQVSLADGDWAYERAKDIRLKWMQTAFMKGGDFALPAGHLSDMAEALRHAHAAGYTIGHEAGDKYRSGKLVLASGAGEEKGGASFGPGSHPSDQAASHLGGEAVSIPSLGLSARSLPRLDRAMIQAACLAHYGSDNIVGIDLTVRGINHSFETGFRRMWSGIRKELSRRERALGTEAEGQDAESGLVHEGPACKATPEPSPQSSPTLKTGAMTVEEAKAFLDGLSSSYMASEHYARWLRARADNAPYWTEDTKQRDADRKQANEIETALRTLQDSGEVRS